MTAEPPGAHRPALAEPPRRPLAAQNLAALVQGVELFSSLGAELYRGDARRVAEQGLAHSGVGGHLRHIHDYYRCFLRGLTDGRVDYDRRDRDPRFEEDLEYALHGLGETMAQLAGITSDLAQRPLEVKMDAEPGEANEQVWCRSTVGRELRFLLSHTIHHYALVRILLVAGGQTCPESFGVAPSTLDHWQRAETCAPSVGSEA